MNEKLARLKQFVHIQPNEYSAPLGAYTILIGHAWFHHAFLDELSKRGGQPSIYEPYRSAN